MLLSFSETKYSPFRAAPSLSGSRRVPGLRDEPREDPVEERVVVVFEPEGKRVFFFHSRGSRLRETAPVRSCFPIDHQRCFPSKPSFYSPQTHLHSLRKFRAAIGASSQKRSTTRSPRDVSMRTDIVLSVFRRRRRRRRVNDGLDARSRFFSRPSETNSLSFSFSFSGFRPPSRELAGEENAL